MVCQNWYHSNLECSAEACSWATRLTATSLSSTVRNQAVEGETGMMATKTSPMMIVTAPAIRNEILKPSRAAPVMLPHP